MNEKPKLDFKDPAYHRVVIWNKVADDDRYWESLTKITKIAADLVSPATVGASRKEGRYLWEIKLKRWGWFGKTDTLYAMTWHDKISQEEDHNDLIAVAFGSSQSDVYAAYTIEKYRIAVQRTKTDEQLIGFNKH